ncbi:MAG: NUDIX hydrolase [Bacteroidota bacterium]|jgi:ADP-ribose pyrophosphatase
MDENNLGPGAPIEVVYEGRFLQTMNWGGWEYVRRKGCTGVVGIIAITEDNCILLVEQFRPPLGKNVIEIPAGLVGDDIRDKTSMNPESAAAFRELKEETGFSPGSMQRLWNGPTTTGLSSETITLYLAQGCRQVQEGGGVEGENIRVHKVPFENIDFWITGKEAAGKIIDLKVRLAVFFWASIRIRTALDSALVTSG